MSNFPHRPAECPHEFKPCHCGDIWCKPWYAKISKPTPTHTYSFPHTLVTSAVKWSITAEKYELNSTHWDVRLEADECLQCFIPLMLVQHSSHQLLLSFNQPQFILEVRVPVPPYVTAVTSPVPLFSSLFFHKERSWTCSTFNVMKFKNSCRHFDVLHDLKKKKTIPNLATWCSLTCVCECALRLLTNPAVAQEASSHFFFALWAWLKSKLCADVQQKCSV